MIVESVRPSEPCSACDARSFSVCNAIELRDLDRLAALAVSLTVEAGRTFIEEGDPAECFFNVTGGTAKLFKLLPDGRRQITGFASTGTFLGLAVSSTYAFGAEALDAMRICRFLEVASNELVAAQEQMLLLGRKTARERLASFLVNRAACLSNGACVCGARVAEKVTLPMTRSDIADYLGLTIETVSRTLTRFKSEHLIDVPSASEIVIRDYAALQGLATGLN